jgi:hypothetical protein
VIFIFLVIFLVLGKFLASRRAARGRHPGGLGDSNLAPPQVPTKLARPQFHGRGDATETLENVALSTGFRNAAVS